MIAQFLDLNTAACLPIDENADTSHALYFILHLLISIQKGALYWGYGLFILFLRFNAMAHLFRVIMALHVLSSQIVLPFITFHAGWLGILVWRGQSI